MSKSALYLFFVVSIMLTSCISTQDLIYLQQKDKSSPTSQITALEGKPYRLQVNDVIRLNIKTIDPKLAQLFSTNNDGAAASQSEAGLYFDGFTVDDHGNIRIPVLGEMNVIGYTLEEIRVRIEKQLLAEYFNKEANLFVTVKLAGLRFTINGEIGGPGTKTIYQEQVNIMEAIANSGDITITGDRKAVTIIRKTPTGVQIGDIDLTDINVMNSPYYYLQPNDFIYIKPLKQKVWGTGKTALESFGTVMTLFSVVSTVFLLLKN
ncbi:polysaccharide biosynthesis/export family protein [Flavobacterium sp. F-328]|uniref:Polysaccharide biosynthesis/export family protein n=1 Tax=Flavobacterium erciyesense TaxID=2825842 RepID=A0ABS5D6F8_9FLAO|nr:polysaccharide biosynthesis/export family protein [Flavobacterium erciyesense]MBQ0909617.1 polysaccharide biosynthesis/export family protein [Flavobacterium erciyesense]